MRLTVLGSAASHAGRGQACAGYLVETAGARVLLDCGNGVLSNLYQVIDPYSLDAVFVTHNHPDHYVDLYSMQAMLRYAPQGPVDPMSLHMPAGMFERLQCLLSGRGAREFREGFAFQPLDSHSPVEIADIRITACPVDHTDPTFALVVESGSRRLCYTSDTSPGQRALTAAIGASLLLAEATLPEQFRGASPHLTASEAGSLAREAGCSTLVMTHVWPTNDREQMLADARAQFHGEIHIATELQSYDVP